jgi:Fe2+ or Zn2+ uptake regulation protein
MSVVREQPTTDAGRLRERGLRVTAPRLAILSMLEQVGGHRAVDELVLALHRAGYHHARTTVYNALDDLARAGLVRAAPVDAGALRYESAGPVHHHFVCRECGDIRNVAVAEDLAARSLPAVEGATVEEFDVVYRGTCAGCGQAAEGGSGTAQATGPVGNGDGPAGRGGHSESAPHLHEHNGQLIDLREPKGPKP